MHNLSASTKLGRLSDERPAVRTRPTNNQLLYKAYFRWQHYPVPSSPIYEVSETESCASVTAAFLQVDLSPSKAIVINMQVMNILQEVEALHCPDQRNVLKILSQDTRHTKVVNLACGTHRVSDELKKHFLTDVEGTQYTTNLDRNRYGADNQYMFTVIRHNLSSLGLCPCLVDVEVLDQKSNETVMVSAGIEACVCDEPWRDVKDDKMSCDGRSCSPGSSVPSEEKSSGKSTSFRQSVPRSSNKHRFSQTPQGEAESFGATANSRSLRTTSISEYNAAVGLASANRHFAQSTSHRLKQLNGKNMVGAESTIDLSRGKQRYNLAASPEERTGLYGKRTRETENDDRMYWEFQTGSDKISPVKSAIADHKRMKSDFGELNFDSERIMDEVSKMQSKLSGMDPLRYQMEEGNARIRRLESELMTLKMEMRRYVNESRQVESQLHANRRVIGMLLNRLQQSLGCQEIGNEMCLQNVTSVPNSDRDVYGSETAMESMMTQRNAFQRETGSELLSNQVVPSVPVPNSMMIALANNAANGTNGHRYDAKWTANASAALPVPPNGGQPVLSMQVEPTTENMTGMTSKMEPHSTCGYRDSHIFEFSYGSVRPALP